MADDDVWNTCERFLIYAFIFRLVSFVDEVFL